MRGEVGKNTPKKEMDNPLFYDVKWMIFDTIWALSQIYLSWIFKSQ